MDTPVTLLTMGSKQNNLSKCAIQLSALLGKIGSCERTVTQSLVSILRNINGLQLPPEWAASNAIADFQLLQDVVFEI